MFSRRLVRFLSIFVMLAVLTQQQAQAQALPIATRVGVGVAGTIERVLIRRGFAANDPIFTKTLGYVGVAANDAVFNVAGTTGMVVAGVAGLPAWATVAIGLGIGALAFGAYKMLTSPVSVTDPATGQTTQRYAVAPSSMSTADIQNAIQNAPPATSVQAPSGLAGQRYRLGDFTCPAGDMQCAALAALPLMPSGIRYFVPQADGSAIPLATVGDWVNNVNNFVQNQLCRSGSSYTNCQVMWDQAPGYDTATQWFTGHWYASYLFTENGQTYTFPMESTLDGSNRYYGANPGGFGINPQYAAPPKTAQSLDELLNQLSPEQLAAPLSADSLAQIADAAWRNAAAKPGYDGLPYSPTDPVTPTDAQNYINANPGSVPTLNDSLAPITGPVTVPVPSTNPLPDPGTNPTPTDSFTPPGLETIPTAAQILAPILGLLPDFKNYVVPSHQAVCPAPSMEFFGKHLVLDAHCTLLDNQTVRQTIYLVMAAVWMAVAVFIILGA